MRYFETSFGGMRWHVPHRVPCPTLGECKVVDGDTIKVAGELWRVCGYDAPPIRGKGRKGPCCDEEAALGDKATDYLAELMAGSASRRALWIDVLSERDMYDRRLINIWVDGRNAGDLLVEAGLAVSYRKGDERHWFCACP